MFEMLKERYPNDPDPDRYEALVYKEMMEFYGNSPSPQQARAFVESKLFASYLYQIMGEPDLAEGTWVQAQRFWAGYMEGRIDATHNRRTGIEQWKEFVKQAEHRARSYVAYLETLRNRSRPLPLGPPSPTPPE